MSKLAYSLGAFDPGWIRLEQAVKGGLAMVTAMAVMLVFVSIAPQPAIASVIFSFMVTFMSFMLVNEAQPRERRRTMLLAVVPFMVMPLFAALVQVSTLAIAMLLLVMMFLSFYVWRYGLRAAELGLSTLLAFYFSWLFGATLASAAWFALGAAIGVASAFFWQFIVRPFDPQRYLRQGVAALGQSAADTVVTIAQQLRTSGSADETRAALKRVHTTRRVIEGQLAGPAGTTEWTPEVLGQLHLHVFNVQQGLEQMAASVTDLVNYRNEIPQPVPELVDESLAALHGALISAGSPGVMAALKQVVARLNDQAHTTRVEGEAWKSALRGLGAGATRVAQSMQSVQALAMQPHPISVTQAAAAPPDPLSGARPAASNKSAQPAQRDLHPTTRLGIQAVVACGLAMVVSTLLNLDRPYWAFWTAYIVVAGPTGESLQKISYRVIGVTLGSLFGTLLVLLLFNNLFILVPLQILALMLALYTRVINYAWAVFWITTFVALLYHVEGVPPGTLLIERPINTLIGAIIAALVVWFVFPIRERAKFGKALAGFLTATDAYLSALVGSLKKAVAPAAISAAAMQASGSYEAVAQTFPALEVESNPISSAHGAAVGESTIINALHADVDGFARFVTDDAGDINTDQVDLIETMHGTIHANIQSVKAALDQQPRPPLHALEDLADAEVETRAGVRAIAHLSRINQAILEMGYDPGIQA